MNITKNRKKMPPEVQVRQRSLFVSSSGSESYISQHSQVHDGFLAALLPTAVNQGLEVQLGVTGLRDHREPVGTAGCRRPRLPDVAVIVVT